MICCIDSNTTRYHWIPFCESIIEAKTLPNSYPIFQDGKIVRNIVPLDFYLRCIQSKDDDHQWCQKCTESPELTFAVITNINL